MATKTLTTPDLVVLSLLKERPMHGYEMNLELEKRDVKDWAAISRPQVYYSLTKLLTLNFIKKVSTEIPSEGPEKTTFEITKKGEEALTKALDNEKWVHHRPQSLFLTWMALSNNASSSVIKKMLQQRKQYLTKELNREKETLKSFKQANDPMAKAGELMVTLTIQQFQLELKWLKKCTSLL